MDYSTIFRFNGILVGSLTNVCPVQSHSPDQEAEEDDVGGDRRHPNNLYQILLDDVYKDSPHLPSGLDTLPESKVY